MNSFSKIGLGALHFGVFLDEAASIKLIHQAFERGINFIDTGPLYGNGISEKIVGKAINKNRSEYHVSTKVGLQKSPRPDGSFGVEVFPLTSANIRHSLNKSLTRLQTDYLDLFQLHAFHDDVPLEETLSTMSGLIDEGLIKAFGVSNYTPSQMLQAVDITRRLNLHSISCVEAHYNLIERKVGDSLSAICRNNNISIAPYRALARGLLTDKYLHGIPENSRAATSSRVKRYLNKELVLLIKQLDKIASENNTTLAELSLLWLMRNELVSTVLIGVREVDSLDMCCKAINSSIDVAVFDRIETAIVDHGYSEWVNNNPEVYFEK